MKKQTFLALLILLINCSLLFSAGPVKIMPLGNSITASKSNYASYRYYLWTMLENAGFKGKIDFVGSLCGVSDQPYPPSCGDPMYPGTEWDWDHQGVSGSLTEWLLEGLPGYLDLNVPDVVLLHHGTNDIHLTGNLPNAITNVSKMIDTLRGRNPNVIIMLAQLIPSTYKIDSFPVYNNLIAQLALSKNNASSPIILVDQFTGYNAYADNGDGTHPTSVGEQKIADKWFTKLTPIIDSLTRISASMVKSESPIIIEKGQLDTIFTSAKASRGVYNVFFFAGATFLGFGTKVNDTLYGKTWIASQTGNVPIYTIVTDSIGQKINSDSLIATVVNAIPKKASIMQIQGTLAASPLIGNYVSSSGIVTAISFDSCEFWIQDPIGDGSTLSSDGLSIRSVTYGPNKPHVSIGDSIRVVGVVAELSDSQNYRSVTCLTMPDTIEIKTKNVALPKAIPITWAPSDAGSMMSVINFLEQHEGMLISINESKVTAPTDDNGWFGIVPKTNSASDFPSPEYVWKVEKSIAGAIDYQPEVLLIGNKTNVNMQVRPGDVVQKITCVVDYENGLYVFQPIPESLVVDSQPAPVYPVSQRYSTYGAIKISSLDADNLCDTNDQPNKLDSVESSAQYEIRIQKITKALIHELDKPAILCLQGIENNEILQDITFSVNQSTGACYKSISFDSYDRSGVENSFIFDSCLFTLQNSFLMSSSAIDSFFGPISTNPTAQPLVGVFNTGAYTLAIINIDLISARSDDALHGYNQPPSRTSEYLRTKQALAIRTWIDSVQLVHPNLLIMIAGQFNDYSFNEAGENSNAISILQKEDGPDPFVKISDYITNASAFCSIKNGRGHMTSDILVNSRLFNLAKSVNILHFNAGFEAKYKNDINTSIKCSENDALEIRF